MRSRSTQVLISALLLGVVGDQMLRGGEPRLGLALLVLLGIACATYIGGRGQRERSWLLAGVGLAALGLVLRDSPVLFAIDLMSVLCMGALAVWHGSGRRFADLALPDPVRATALALLTAAAGAPEVVRGAAPESEAAGIRAKRVRALAIGAVLAVPPLFIVSGLLGSADVLFARFLDDLGEFIFANGVEHLLVIGGLGWLAAGWLQGTIGGPTGVRVPEVRSPGIAFTSVSVGLYGLVALLALFLGTQTRALFGGAAYLAETAGLTVAEYARDGFFQLVVAAGVVLGTLLVADWLMAGTAQARSETETDRAAVARDLRRYIAVGTVLVLLVAALMGSAIARIWLYVSSYGLSLERAFAIALMVWVFVALALFAGTVLRGRRGRFVPALLLASMGWVALLNVAGPEALVVRVNVSRAVAGRPFDVAYHARLSADALPALLAAAPRLAAGECEALGTALAEHWAKRAADRVGREDWRGLDLPLARALAWNERAALPSCRGPG